LTLLDRLQPDGSRLDVVGLGPAIVAMTMAIGLLGGCGGATPEPETAPTVVDGEGGTFRHPAGVTIAVPAGWSISRTADTLSLLSPSQAVLMMFFVVEADELEVALRAMDKTIARYIDDAEVHDRHKTELNGMSAIVADGTGKMDGEPVEVGIALALTPIGKVLIVLGLARHSAPPERQREVQRIIRSIAPAMGAS